MRDEMKRWMYMVQTAEPDADHLGVFHDPDEARKFAIEQRAYVVCVPLMDRERDHGRI
jgi:hypothetical protein